MNNVQRTSAIAIAAVLSEYGFHLNDCHESVLVFVGNKVKKRLVPGLF